MGLPDEGLGLPRKKSRLGLSSKKKESHKEACLAEEQSNSTGPIMGLTNHALTSEESKNHGYEEKVCHEKKDPLVPPVTSLYNIGNTCYLNCMLQTLRYTPGFVENLSELRRNIRFEESKLRGKDSNGNTRQKPSVWKLVVCLDDLFRHMRSKESDYADLSPTDSTMMSIRPDALLDEIRKFNPLFEENYQHDAQELLRCLLGCLDDAEAELEKEQKERRQLEEEEKLASYDNDSHLDSNHGKRNSVDRLEAMETVNVVSATRTCQKRGRKRKSDTKEIACKERLGSSVMTNFLRGKKSQPQKPVSICQKSTTVKDNNDITSNNGSVDARNDDVQNVSGIKDSKDNGHKLGQELNCSGDAPDQNDLDTVNTLMKTVDSLPCNQGRKRLRLGMRGTGGQVSQLQKQSRDSPNSTLKETENNQEIVDTDSKFTCSESKNEIIIISDEEEEDDIKAPHLIENHSQSSAERDNMFSRNVTPRLADNHSKSTLFDDISSITEDSGSSLSGQNRIPSHEKEKDEKRNCQSEEPILSSNQNATPRVISPGKHLTIHSPLGKDGKQHSNSFLSRIQYFLPNAARKALKFSSSNRYSDPGLPALFDISVTHSNYLLEHQSQDLLQSNAGLESKTKFNSECLKEAELKLKRCDWLGVSPVRSVSANLVFEQMKNESHLTAESPIKRKISFDAKDKIETKHKLSENSNKSECDKSKSEIKEIVENRLLSQIDSDNICEDSKLRNAKRKTDSMIECNTNSPKQNAVCKTKRLSVQLKKMDWLGEDSKRRSFNVQEIMERDGLDTHALNCLKETICSEQNLQDIHQKKVVDVFVCQDSSDETKHKKEDEKKLVQGLFGGLMGHRTSCCECEKSSHRSETFLDVSIPVRALSTHEKSSSDEEDEDDKRNTKSCVFSLLKSLSTRERLCNDNKYFCDQCFCLVEAEHFCFFQDLPKVLAIHLKRFDAGLGSLTGRVSKINDHVSVSEHLPCLMPKCQESCSRHRYTLYAVVTHSGSSIVRGHYRSYVKVTSSFNQHLSHFKNGGGEHKNRHQGSFSWSYNAPQSSRPTHENDPCSDTNASSPNLIGDTVEDIKNNSFVYSEQSQSQSNCNPDITRNASMDSRCGYQTVMKREDEKEENAFWLECDDEFIRVFEEEEFLDQLSGEEGALLGTPYILFYHQNNT